MVLPVDIYIYIHRHYNFWPMQYKSKVFAPSEGLVKLFQCSFLHFCTNTVYYFLNVHIKVAFIFGFFFKQIFF